MMTLARGVQRIDVDCNVRQIPQMMQKLVPNLRGDLMPLADGEPRIDGDVHFGIKPVAQPSDADFRYVLNPDCVIHGMSNLIEDLGVHAVQQTCEDTPAGFPHDMEDGDSVKRMSFPLRS